MLYPSTRRGHRYFSVKAGRQEVSYDDQRIFGSVGWAHRARSHDMAIFQYEKNVKLHFGIAHHENGLDYPILSLN